MLGTVYHVITECETVTFTSPRKREAWLKQWGQPEDILCESDLDQDAYGRIEAWERGTPGEAA